MADLDLVRELAAADDYLAVVATTRPDGTVHGSLVKAGVLEDPATGEPVVGIVVAGSARKLALLRSTGRATVVFRHGWRWVAVDGPVRLEGPDDPAPAEAASPEGGAALAGVLRAVYVAAGGTHDDWKAFDRTMVEDRRCAVFVTPSRISGN